MEKEKNQHSSRHQQGTTITRHSDPSTAENDGKNNVDDCDDWSIQSLSMESILGIPMEFLFREVGGGGAGRCSNGMTTPTSTTTTSSNNSRSNNTTNRPIMNRIEADQFIKVTMLSQEFDVVVQLVEQVLKEQQLVRRFKTNIVTKYGPTNPYILPLLPILTILEQQQQSNNCNSNNHGRTSRGNGTTFKTMRSSSNDGQSSSTTSSSSTITILHQVYTNLSHLTWDLQSCAIQLQQSAEQNWTLVDSLLDVLPIENDHDHQDADARKTGTETSSASLSTAQLLVSEKQALAELQEEVARRINTILNLQTTTATIPKPKGGSVITKATTTKGELDQETVPTTIASLKAQYHTEKNNDKLFESSLSPIEHHQQHSSSDSPCRTLFVSDQPKQRTQPQQQQQQQKESRVEDNGSEAVEEKKEKNGAVDHHCQEEEQEEEEEEDDVYTPIADFCAKVFGSINVTGHTRNYRKEQHPQIDGINQTISTNYDHCEKRKNDKDEGDDRIVHDVNIDDNNKDDRCRYDEGDGSDHHHFTRTTMPPATMTGTSMAPPKATTIAKMGELQLKRPRNTCDDDHNDNDDCGHDGENRTMNEKKQRHSPNRKVPASLTGRNGGNRIAVVDRNDLNVSQRMVAIDEGSQQQGVIVGVDTLTMTTALMAMGTDTSNLLTRKNCANTHGEGSGGNSNDIKDNQNEGMNKEVKGLLLGHHVRHELVGTITTATNTASSQTTTATQSPLINKGFQYTAADDDTNDDNTNDDGNLFLLQSLREGAITAGSPLKLHSSMEDSQMSFQTKVHAAEALTGLFNGIV
jgi:hypothetical protein